MQDNPAALAATALKIQSDGGITGMQIDKNYTDVSAATVTGLHVDFDRTVPGSGTAAFTDIGITGGGKGSNMLYLKGVKIEKISNDNIVSKVVELVEKKAKEIENTI